MSLPKPQPIVSRTIILLASILTSGVSLAFGLTTDEVIEKVVRNIQGPAGKMVVAEGRMKFARRDLDIRTARYYQDGIEGFQIDVLSPVEDQEVPDAMPQTDKKYRVVRKAAEISTLTYLPSLRRGRKISYVPQQGILGSDYPYYLLPLVNDILHDFSYTFADQRPETPVLIGKKKEDARTPYSAVELHLRQQAGVYLIEQAIYTGQAGSGFTLVFQGYEEFTPGYWAPQSVTVKNTTFSFSRWQARPPFEWLHSTNHGQLDVQGIPYSE